MKPDIHPQYYPKATITCACGHSLVVGSTVASISVEVCSACHPFYTGKQKLLDTAGRLERFQKRAAQKQVAQDTRKGKKKKNIARAARKKENTEK